MLDWLGGSTWTTRDRQRAIDSLASSSALIDSRGVVLMTNLAWKRFAGENGGGEPAGIGANYFSACAAADDDIWAARAGSGLRSIVAGQAQSFSMIYPCHSATCESWYRMDATPCDGWAPGCILVTHTRVGSVSVPRGSQGGAWSAPPGERAGASSPRSAPQLSGRELEILDLVSRGFTNPQIGLRLGITAATVKTHLEHVRGKLGVRNRATAVAVALRLGLLS